MTSGLLLPSPALKHIVEYYFHHAETFDRVSFENLYSTPILECLSFNLGPDRLPQKMKYGEKWFNLSGRAHLFGQPTGPVDIGGRYSEFIVVKFRPLGVRQLTGLTMHHIANGIAQAEDIFGTSIRFVIEQMREVKSTREKVACLDLFLQQHLRKRKKVKLHPTVKPSLALLGKNLGNINITALQDQTHTTKKTLERAFATNVGVSPKLYARIVRYNFAKAHIEQSGVIDWGRIVHEHGFYDQSHFINEFKCFSGKTPIEYYNGRIVASTDLSVLLSPHRTFKSL